MSVPTRRTVCATCRQKPCACVTDADRIAQLTAELAEARRVAKIWRNDERVAHKRTRDELAAARSKHGMTASLQNDLARTKSDLASERAAHKHARALLAQECSLSMNTTEAMIRAQSDLARTKAELVRVSEAGKREYEQSLKRDDYVLDVVAESAAMHDVVACANYFSVASGNPVHSPVARQRLDAALGALWKLIGVNENDPFPSHPYDAAKDALARKSASRAIAERVRLWRELEATMRIDGNVGLIDDVLEKLAALDAKGSDS